MPSMLLSLRSKPKCDHSLDYSPSAANHSTEEFFLLAMRVTAGFRF
jgi:hypothetical protein